MNDPQDSGMLSPAWAGIRVASLDDASWIRAMLRTEVALANAQARLGLLPLDSARTIESTARDLSVDPRVVASGVHDNSNPAIPLVQELQRAVEIAAPGVGDHVHLGATSQDVLDTAAMLVSMNALYELEHLLGTIRAGVVRLIDEHGDLPMAGRTIGQHAVPVTFGVKASAWLNGLVDAERRVSDLIERGLPVSLAGAAGTLAAYGGYGDQTLGDPLDPFDLVDAVADELGLDPHYQPWHTVRTPLADLASCLSLVNGVLGKIAADVQVMSRTEVGEVSEGADGISTAMPQKQNPVKTTLVLAASRQVPALCLVVLQAMMAEDERPVGAWQSEWQPLREAWRCILGSASHTRELVDGLQIHEAAIDRNLRSSGAGIVAERINIALAPLIGKLEAKSVVRQVVLQHRGAGGALRDALHEAIATRGGDPSRIDLAELLDPRSYVGSARGITNRALARSGALD
ncbi:lyase family protein [Aeromicrobium sp. CTD01-1L150]|uniref:lyase family protein n=1 Tax=Aeromicrobium sp. CTD01-1L150 TaxID=3341830 RepID=UPI0035C06340